VFQRLSHKLFVSLATAIALTVITVFGAASASEEEGFETPFLPAVDVMADVEKTLAAAKAEGKLALIVMGATWCHDSRGLVKRFRDDSISPTIDQNYQTLFVDVGHLDQARAVNQRFGMPSIYATPTVMIVDPETGVLKNSKTMHLWRNADRISYSDTKDYFANEAVSARAPAPEVGAILESYYAAIDAFEQVQAERLVKGYDLIGPQLAMGRGNYPEGFEALWGEVRGFRYKLTDDLLALRAQAEELAAEGINEPLVFPSYAELSWE